MADFRNDMQHKNSLFRQKRRDFNDKYNSTFSDDYGVKSQLQLRLSFLADETTSACSNVTSLDIFLGE
jgi:hypothetical protein